MSSTTFIDGQTVVAASWANDVNVAIYTAIGNGTTAPATAANVKTNLSLNLVDNTSDASKPVSTATQTALDLKQDASAAVTLTGTQTLTNKTLTTSKLKAAQLGDSGTATNNFTLTAEAADGTMKLARGNVGATTQDLITVSAGNVVTGASGAVLVGNGPVFSVKADGTQNSVVSGTVVIQLKTEEFDTASAFDSTSAYQFTPQVAGHYQVNFTVDVSSNTANQLDYVFAQIFKNGDLLLSSNGAFGGVTTTRPGEILSSGSGLVLMNGTTDYLELRATIGVASGTATIAANVSRFSGFLARAA